MEKARDSAYQETDYMRIKIKKVRDQEKLAFEKLDKIKTFQRQMEEVSRVDQQTNILSRKRVSYAEFYEDKAKYYKPDFASKIDHVVEEATALPVPAEAEDGEDGEEEPLPTAQGTKSGEGEEEGSGKTLSDSKDGEGEGPDPATDVSGSDEARQPTQPDPELPPAPQSRGGMTPPDLPRIEEDEEDEEEIASNHSGTNEDDPVEAPPAETPPAAPLSAASQNHAEIGTQTPEALVPKLDFSDIAVRPSDPRPLSGGLSQVERINQRLFEIKKRKALAYRDLSTATLRSLAEEALEEKELYKKLKKLNKRGRRR